MTQTNTQLEADIAVLIFPPIASLGFAVLRVRFQGGLLQVMVEAHDHAHAMTVDDCARISRSISPSLDTSPLLDTAAYRLEVTSPGVARPLFCRADYERFTGTPVKLTTRELVDGRRRFSGHLLGIETIDGADKVALDTDDGRIVLDFDLIESGKLDGGAVLADKQHARKQAEQLPEQPMEKAS